MRIHLTCLFSMLFPALGWAQTLTPLPAETPQLRYKVDPSWPELPEGWNLLATPDVAADARGNVYVFHRGPHPIIELDAKGSVSRQVEIALGGRAEQQTMARVNAGSGASFDQAGHNGSRRENQAKHE